MDESKIEEMFDKEDDYWWFAARREMVLMLLKKYVKKGTRLLDAGCGTGILTKTIENAYKVTAIDVSKKALALARKRKPKAKLLWANLEKRLPFPKDSFTGITLLDVLEHIDDRKSLPNLARVMKPEGVIIITVPAYPWLFSYWDILHQHKRRYTRTHLIQVLKQYGFTIEHSSYFNTLFFPLILFVRIIKSSFDKSHRDSDCFEMPKKTNNFLHAIFKKETFLATKFRIPFGLSLLVVARKKK